MASNIDCRETDDVSVPLPPSPKACITCTCSPDCNCAGGVAKPELPVNSSLLNASTSMDARPGLVTFVGGIIGLSRSGCSMVSSVFENGFAGALLGLPIASSSDISEVALSNGSSLRGNGGVGSFANIE
jgi:hypothetical protein